MRDDEQDPAEEISSPEALASALEYLHAEAKLSGFDFVAHLIQVAAAAIEDEGCQADETENGEPQLLANSPPKLRLVQGGISENGAQPDNTEGTGS